MGRLIGRGGKNGRGARGVIAGILWLSLALPLAPQAADVPPEQVVRYLLATVEAFRTLYMESVVEQVQRAGLHPKEEWDKDDRAVMLPFQFVKLAGERIGMKELEIGIISLTPLYTSNFPKTQAEVDALKRLQADPRHEMITFVDGPQVKGLIADFAVTQACADCHNHHPNATRRDFKKGDLIGAVVVRLKRS